MYIVRAAAQTLRSATLMLSETGITPTALTLTESGIRPEGAMSLKAPTKSRQRAHYSTRKGFGTIAHRCCQRPAMLSETGTAVRLAASLQF